VGAASYFYSRDIGRIWPVAEGSKYGSGEFLEVKYLLHGRHRPVKSGRVDVARGRRSSPRARKPAPLKRIGQELTTGSWLAITDPTSLRHSHGYCGLWIAKCGPVAVVVAYHFSRG
jgi:hypothetical protein